MERRVVITGIDAITPLGLSADETWRAMLAARSGIGPITQFDSTAFDVHIAGEVRGFDAAAALGRKEAQRMDRYCQLGVAAGLTAMRDAGLAVEDDPERVGILLGSGIGGISTLGAQFEVLFTKGPQRVSPFLIPMMISNMASGMLAILTGAKGPCTSVVTACATSTNAIGDAYHIVRRGDADAMIAGGSEAAVAPVAISGFSNMKALSTRDGDPTRVSRPFDAGRDGFVIAEGAGAVILEEYERARQRGARIYGEILGYGFTADAYHMTQPAPHGEGARRAMQMAVRNAGVRWDEMDYINAHGTSTQFNDALESEAIRDTFGDHAYRVAVSSTKSMTGHLLGAAGAVELIACLLAIRDGAVPPTINYETPDPQCDLDYVPNEAREQTVKVAMSNGFGFGGQNACVVVRSM